MLNVDKVPSVAASLLLSSTDKQKIRTLPSALSPSFINIVEAGEDFDVSRELVGDFYVFCADLFFSSNDYYSCCGILFVDEESFVRTDILCPQERPSAQSSRTYCTRETEICFVQMPCFQYQMILTETRGLKIFSLI